MKLEKGALVCSFLFVILLGVVSADCAIKKVSDGGCSSSGETGIIKLYGSSNTHGELTSQNNYDNVLCCTGVSSTTCDGGNEILRLSSVTNAHAESPFSKYNDLSNRICATGLSCTTTTGGCLTGNAILSLSSAINAHISVGNDPNYNIKICCDVSTVARCGDSISGNTPGEECDDGKDGDNTDECTESCLDAKCGDGFTQLLGKDGVSGNSDDEECDDGNLVSGDGCSNICEDEGPTILSCRDYEKVENNPGEACNENPANIEIYTGNWEDYQDLCQRRLNGIGCVWDSDGEIGKKCLQDTEFEFHPDNPINCIETQTSCKYSEDSVGSCDTQSIITINYKLSTLSNDPDEICKTEYSQQVPCPETSMLPFFGAYQFIITLTIVSIIYAFMIYRKKR